MLPLLLEGHQPRHGPHHKLSDRAFSQVLLHKIIECTRDPSQKSVSSPRAMLKMSAIAEFIQQDWVESILQGNHSSSSKKKYVDPNVAFPFQDDFSVGTIHIANVTPANSRTAPLHLKQSRLLMTITTSASLL